MRTPPPKQGDANNVKGNKTSRTLLYIMGGAIAIGSYFNYTYSNCVPGNDDYEESKGFCSGYWGKKESEARIAKEKYEADSKEKLDKKTKTDEWYNELSQFTCERSLKENLRNPRTYERDGDFATLTDTGEDKTIIWKFRAENGFGGLNVSSASCDISRRNGGEVKVRLLE